MEDTQVQCFCAQWCYEVKEWTTIISEDSMALQAQCVLAQDSLWVKMTSDHLYGS